MAAAIAVDNLVPPTAPQSGGHPQELSNSSTDMPLSPTSTKAAMDRRKHAAANRAPMACLPCREAKHKCEGQPPAKLAHHHRRQSITQENGALADISCPRCASHKIPCIWLPKAKLGRPRKDTATTPSKVVKSPKRDSLASSSPQIARSDHPGFSMPSTNGSQAAPRRSASGPYGTAANAVAAAAAAASAPSSASSSSYSLPTPFDSYVSAEPHGMGSDPCSSTTGTAAPRNLDSAYYDMWSSPPSYMHQPMTSQGHILSPPLAASSWSTQMPSSWQMPMANLTGLPDVSGTLNGGALQRSEVHDGMADPNNILHGSDYPHMMGTNSNASSNLPAPPLGTSSSAHLPMPDAFTSQTASPTARVSRAQMQNGLHLYFHRAFRCCLALAPRDYERISTALDQWGDIAATLPWSAMPLEARDLLTLAQTTALIGLRLQRIDEGRVDNKYSDEARLNEVRQQGLQDILDRQVDSTTPTSLQQWIYCVQALLLGSVLEYGLGRVQRSQVYLHKAIHMVAQAQLNLFDDQATVGAPISARSVDAAGWSVVKEDFRRLFWETCMMETMMCISTNGNASQVYLRRGMPVKVNFPDSASCLRGTLCDYDLRFRATSMLLEALQPPPDPSSRMQRLGAMLGMTAEVASQAKDRFLATQEEREMEMAAAAFLMSTAASIQLITLAIIPPGEDAKKMLSKRPNLTLRGCNPDTPSWMLETAVSKLSQASDDIMWMTQVYNARRGDVERRATLALQVDCPYRGGAQVMAITGYLVAICFKPDANGKGEAEAWVGGTMNQVECELRNASRMWPVASSMMTEVGDMRALSIT